MWKLGYLIGETWVEEDVTNAHAELVYFQLAIKSDMGTPPPFLFEPTSFFDNARSLYYQVPRQYSSELMLFCHQLLVTHVASYGFSVWTNGHYAAYYRTSRGIMEHGDSMHQPPPADTLDILNWVLEGIQDESPVRIKTGAIARQGSLRGDGSCAIAAHNFVHCHADPTVLPWDGSASQHFRDNILRDLLLYDSIASNQTGVRLLILIAKQAIAYFSPRNLWTGFCHACQLTPSAVIWNGAFLDTTISTFFSHW
jgi:hypothetical protein